MKINPGRRLDRLFQQTTMKDSFADEGRECGMVGVVVEGITVGDALDNQLAGAVKRAPVFRLPSPRCADMRPNSVVALNILASVWQRSQPRSH